MRFGHLICPNKENVTLTLPRSGFHRAPFPVKLDSSLLNGGISSSPKLLKIYSTKPRFDSEQKKFKNKGKLCINSVKDEQSE